MFVTVSAGNTSSRTATFSGRFAVQLISGSEDELRNVFVAYAPQLRAHNRQPKVEAAEALAFVDTPLVVPYLLPMLQIDNLEVIGIHALARHPGRESQQAIKSMLSHADSAVVGAALEEIERLHMPITRNEVHKLLGSSNPNNQWLALGWLAARPSREDLPLIAPLLNSPNAPVRERARAYSDRFQ
ncbi:MAG TPA: HEAT repeat domain-containing protein [Bryobacteraceae bacterium]|nr:HEAT repeat domain-containing protein [Bryobacteraceae bacterium]